MKLYQEVIKNQIIGPPIITQFLYAMRYLLGAYLNRNSNRFHDIETPSGPRLDINLSNSDTLRSPTMVLRGYVGVPGYRNDHLLVNHNN